MDFVVQMVLVYVLMDSMVINVKYVTNINLNGSPDLRYTKNPEILKIKLSIILEAQRKTN